MKTVATLLLCVVLTVSAAAQSPSPAPGESPVQLQLDPSFTEDLRIAQSVESGTDGKVKPDIH